MEVVRQPEALPSCCIMCPGSAREWFIDTGIQIEWYGAVVICKLCVVAMGQMFGMLTEVQAENVLNNRNVLQQEIFELQKKLAGLEMVERGMAAAGYVVPDHSGDVSVPSSSHQGNESGLSESKGSVGDEGGAAPESVHDEGVDVIRSDEPSPGILSL